MRTLGDLFAAMVANARAVHAARLDGLAFWQQFKPLLATAEIPIEWKAEMSTALFERIMALHEYDGSNTMVKNHHFLMQTARIPANEAGTARKLIQVALNAGQHSAEPTGIDIPEAYTECSWYVDADTCEMPLAELFDDDVVDTLEGLLS